MRRLLVLMMIPAIGACAPKTTQAPAGEVAVTVTDDGFKPERVDVPRGAPVTLVFTRTSDQSCITDVTFARLGKTYPLPLNQPVRVEIPKGVQDTLSFVCPMDMYRGTVAAMTN